MDKEHEIAVLRKNNNELVNALHVMLDALNTALKVAPDTKVTISTAFAIVGAKEKANKAIERHNAS